MMEIPAGQFKARCLQLMDEVQETGKEIIITKHGRPVARLVPIVETPTERIFGCMKGTASILGDIVAPLEERWEVDQ
jgi:prevent-host-death family protein